MIIKKGVSVKWAGNTWETYSNAHYDGSKNSFTVTSGTITEITVIYFI